jgi:hypothetical protein
LKIKAKLDSGIYQIGQKISDDELELIKIKTNFFHGDWNYIIYPNKYYSRFCRYDRYDTCAVILLTYFAEEDNRVLAVALTFSVCFIEVTAILKTKLIRFVRAGPNGTIATVTVTAAVIAANQNQSHCHHNSNQSNSEKPHLLNGKSFPVCHLFFFSFGKILKIFIKLSL